MINFPLKFPVIKVEQPLGVFYAASIPAAVLLKTTYTIRAELLDDEEDSFLLGGLRKLKGGQRETNLTRLKQIKQYTEEVDASFPNSIILGANYNENGKMIDDENVRWSIVEENGCLFLIIPSDKQLASIIDGQHRIYGFKESKVQDMQMLCSVYIDLPIPYHAQIFIKINMNQKRVDKNLAYNLFQFNMNEGEIESWSPETLSVYIARVLLEEKHSPLYKKMRLGIANYENTGTISMASIIDGILSLISTNPEKDRSLMHQTYLLKRTRKILNEEKTSAPLRELYLLEQDKTLFNIINSYFEVINEYFWQDDEMSILKKTLGIHALFDFLKEITRQNGVDKDYSKIYFKELFLNAKNINFDDSYFGVQTKVRSRIKNTLFVICGVKNIDDINVKEPEKELLISFLD